MEKKYYIFNLEELYGYLNLNIINEHLKEINPDLNIVDFIIISDHGNNLYLTNEKEYDVEEFIDLVNIGSNPELTLDEYEEEFSLEVEYKNYNEYDKSTEFRIHDKNYVYKDIDL